MKNYNREDLLFYARLLYEYLFVLPVEKVTIAWYTKEKSRRDHYGII